jgi:hypothetical protein
MKGKTTLPLTLLWVVVWRLHAGCWSAFFYFLPFSHFAHKLYSFFFILSLNGMSACVKNLDPKVNFLCLLSLPFLRLTFLLRKQLFIAFITYLSKLTL